MLDPRWKNPQSSSNENLHLWAQDLVKELRKSAKLDSEDPVFTGSLTGSPIIGGTDPSSSLTLQSTSGAGTTDFIRFLVGNNGAVEAGRILTDGKWIFGHTAAFTTGLGAVNGFVIHRLSTNTLNVELARWTNDSSGVNVFWTKSRGTSPNTHGLLGSSDVIGVIRAIASDGVAYQNIGNLSFETDGATGASDMPCRLVVGLAPDGSATTVIRLTLKNSGQLLLSGTTATPAGGTTGLGLAFGSTSNFGIFFGSGAPTLSAAQGSLYIRSDGSSTSTRLYVNTTGSTTWTNVVTAT